MDTTTRCPHPHATERRPDARSTSARPVVRPSTTQRDWHEAAALLGDLAMWIEVAAGIDMASVQPAFVEELRDLARVYGRPGSAFLVADDGLILCGTAAVRRDADGSAELKRVYVRPSARGRGIAAQLIDRAIEVAGASGATTLWLETLPGLMDTAIALYRSRGFVEVADATRSVDIEGVIRMERRIRA